MITSKPLITVIITTYNRRDLLYDAIQSVLNQTYANYEIIVLNDCGEDVWDIIQSFSSKKILYLSTIKNSGPAFARNTASNIAKGEYICYLDDDDVFLPTHLETTVKVLVSNKVDVVYTNALYVDEKIVNNDRIVLKEYPNPKDMTFSYRKILAFNYIPINTLVYKKSLFNNIHGFNETLNSHEDWEFFIRLARQRDFLYIDTVTVKIFNRIYQKDNITESTYGNHYETYKKIYRMHPSNNISILKERLRRLYHLSKTSNQALSFFLDLFKKPNQFIAFLYLLISYAKEKYDR